MSFLYDSTVNNNGLGSGCPTRPALPYLRGRTTELQWKNKKKKKPQRKTNKTLTKLGSFVGKTKRLEVLFLKIILVRGALVRGFGSTC